MKTSMSATKAATIMLAFHNPISQQQLSRSNPNVVQAFSSATSVRNPRISNSALTLSAASNENPRLNKISLLMSGDSDSNSNNDSGLPPEVLKEITESVLRDLLSESKESTAGKDRPRRSKSNHQEESNVDISKEIARRVAKKVNEFTGHDSYEFGDLSREIAHRIENQVNKFTGHDSYKLGDVSREIERRRQNIVKDYLGEEGAKNYQFGDISKKAASDVKNKINEFTGKDHYEFGDLTGKVASEVDKKVKDLWNNFMTDPRKSTKDDSKDQ